MKKPYYLILIILGVTLVVFGALVYRNTETTVKVHLKSTDIYDLLFDSKGYAKLELEYPAELLKDEEGTITLKVAPDSNLKKVLSQGLTIDTLISPTRLTTSSERRQTKAIDAGGTIITWTVKSSRLGPTHTKLSFGLSDSRTDPKLYPLAAQDEFELDIPIVEVKSKAKFTEFIGPILLGMGGISLIAGFVLAGKDFDQANKKKKTKR